MQRRILVVALTAVALAVTLLGTPLALVQRQLLHQNERGELLGEAVTVAGGVPRSLRLSPERVTLPPGLDSDDRAAVYNRSGQLLAGIGPPTADSVVREALQGRPADGLVGQDLVVAVPVLRGEDVVAVVRASSPRAEVQRRELLTSGAVAGVALFAAVMAMLLALRLARRLATPIRELQAAAEELGDGNFTVQAPSSGIKELDGVATSVNATAQRLGHLLERERAFTAHASHQLRTPLTALRLRLDSALSGDPRQLPAATTEALAIVDDLETTVADLLAVARGRPGAASLLDLEQLLDGLPNRWQGLLAAQGRSLLIRTDDPPDAAGRAATVRQVLDVLLDNAYRHGAGTVQVVARDAGGALAIDVVDEGGPGRITPVDAADASVRSLPARRSPGVGIGLGLARSLLVADGGRLLLTSAPGRTCATMLLPPIDPSEEG